MFFVKGRQKAAVTLYVQLIIFHGVKFNVNLKLNSNIPLVLASPKLPSICYIYLIKPIRSGSSVFPGTHNMNC